MTTSDASQADRKRRRRVIAWLLLVILLLLAALIGHDRLDSSKAGEPAGDEPEAAAEPASSDAPASQPGLEFTVSDGGRRVQGSFGAVRFDAEALQAERARARFWLDAPNGDSLEVVIESATEGAVTWRDVVVTGRGAIPDATAAALASLADGPLGEALARIPLDLACQPEAAPVPPAVGAALVMPWQVLLKYGAGEPAIEARQRSEASVCGYFGRKSQPGLAEVPHPNLVMLSGEGRVPVAGMFLPLDGMGQRGGSR